MTYEHMDDETLKIHYDLTASAADNTHATWKRLQDQVKEITDEVSRREQAKSNLVDVTLCTSCIMNLNKQFNRSTRWGRAVCSFCGGLTDVPNGATLPTEAVFWDSSGEWVGEGVENWSAHQKYLNSL